MPNEKVKYFRSKEKIKDRIVYIKDKDVIGFDTASIYCFHLYLWNLTKFNVSNNIILMDDDYFIGKPINKSDFFYYDEKKKKVLPNIVSDEFRELNKHNINKDYKYLFSKKDKIDPHTSEGWKLHTATSFKILSDNYPIPLIDAGFTHNALSIYTPYVKEIYDLIKDKYKYANKILYSKQRTVYDIQFQTLYNTFTLNIKKAKVHIIPRIFYDLNQLKKRINLDIELFVINTSGENKYSDKDFQNLKMTLESKFNKQTPYERIDIRILIKKTINYFLLVFYISILVIVIFILILNRYNIKIPFQNIILSLLSFNNIKNVSTGEENCNLNIMQNKY